ncbi:hypothetical protein [Methanosarcina soligelidi]|uniref:hypothetical protein n=1 Tax=Methanosarcina soligelidi TaxID=1036677 RepID=UPI00064F5FB5|nr:hypothetical protein [Methanosarcina soligelidi]
MSIPGCKKFPVDEKIETFQKLPVIKNYYLVLGGGKIGTDFLQYARKNNFPFVLVIDSDENASASKEAQVLETESELLSLLRKKTEASLKKTGNGSRSGKGSEGENDIPETGKSEAYFYKMDIHRVPFLFSSGIPEYIIPAIPFHAAAYMLADLLKFPILDACKGERNKENLAEISSPEEGFSGEKSPVSELFIKPEDPGLMSYFNNIESVFPEDVIAGSYPEHGMLFLSYAREGEICPDGCPGPRDRCPAFGRKKPRTITEYTRELVHSVPGWVFESHQMKPGTGGLKGAEFRQNILEILEFLGNIQCGGNEKKPEKIEDRAFFIATTCTCHGVLNLFYVT